MHAKEIEIEFICVCVPKKKVLDCSFCVRMGVTIM